MRVLVTGATGFVGSAVAEELAKEGHQVIGLARNAAGEAKLAAAGVSSCLGDLDQPGSLAQAAEEAKADAIIHTAFNHDFSRFAENCAAERAVISALAKPGRPLLVTSGIGMITSTDIVTEQSRADYQHARSPRSAMEALLDELAQQGMPVGAVRLPPSVHGQGDHGFVPMLIDIARRQGRAAYVGQGQNQWPAVHRLDAARCFALVLSKGFEPGDRFHAVAETGIEFRAIAESIGQHLNLPIDSLSPEQAADYFGGFVHFAAIDNRASSDWTRQQLGWQPSGPDLLSDMDQAGYF